MCNNMYVGMLPSLLLHFLSLSTANSSSYPCSYSSLQGLLADCLPFSKVARCKHRPSNSPLSSRLNDLFAILRVQHEIPLKA